MNSELSEHWHSGSGPMLFDSDYAAWLKTLSPKARLGEVKLEWQNLGPFTISAYGVHLGLIGSFQFMRHRNKLPAVLPDYCTPEGFYLKAIETRRQQVGLHNPFSPTPYERLSAFSQFIYQRMAQRITISTGLSHREPPIDDGLGDASNGPTGDDDGLGGVGSPGDLDDGLGGPETGSRRLIYHGESDSYVECADEFETYELMHNAAEDLLDVTGVDHHEAAFRGRQVDDGLGDGL